MAESGEPLRLCLLGSPYARRGATPLDLGPAKQRAVLAALVLRAGATVSHSRLIDDIWGEEPPNSGTKALPPYMYRLRGILDDNGQDPLLRTESGGYRFQPHGTQIDVTQFRQLVAAAETARETHDLAAATTSYHRALGLFQAEALAGLPGPFAQQQRFLLTEERLKALRGKIECQLQLGQHVAILSELSSLAQQYPRDERFTVLLMQALYRDGRQSEALSAYGRLRDHLVTELGVEPGSEARRVHLEMLRGEHETPAPALTTTPVIDSDTFRVIYHQLAAPLQEALRLLCHHLAPEFDQTLASAMLDRPAGDTLFQLRDAQLLRPVTGGYRLSDGVASQVRRHTAPLPPGTITAARVRVLRLYLIAARCASDQGTDAFPTGPRDLPNPFSDHDSAADWLDTMSVHIVDLVGNATDNGHFDYACWIAEAMMDYLSRHDRYRDCHAMIEAALPWVPEVTDQRIGPALHVLNGIAYGVSGRFPQAEACLRQGIALAEQHDQPRERARGIGGLGIVCRFLGRDAEAVTRLSEAAELAIENGDDWLTGMTHSHLGELRQQRGDHSAALRCFQTALATAERIDRPRVIAKSLYYAANWYLTFGRYHEAAGKLRRAVAMAKRSGDGGLRAATLTKLGSAEHGLGRLDTAIAMHHAALELVTRRSSTEMEIEVRNRLATSYLASRQHESAYQQFRHVLALTESGAFPDQRRTAQLGLDRTD